MHFNNKYTIQYIFKLFLYFIVEERATSFLTSVANMNVLVIKWWSMRFSQIKLWYQSLFKSLSFPSHKHTHTHTRTHARTNARTHAHTHTHTHTHTQTNTFVNKRVSRCFCVSEWSCNSAGNFFIFLVMYSSYEMYYMKNCLWHIFSARAIALSTVPAV